MARKPRALSLRKRLDTLIAKQEPLVAKAFRDAIKAVNDEIVLANILRQLEAGDINAAIEAFNITTAAFRSLERAIQEVFEASGAETLARVPVASPVGSGRIVVRFDMRNPRAETLLREVSGRAITRIVEDQRAMIREVLEQGLINGRNPRTTALDIIGRINPATGRREGGLIGLTRNQAQYVANAREELSSLETLSDYLQRTRRDRRFDRTIAKAIKEGVVPDAKTREKIVGRYSDSLLQLRGETIARTETIQALNAAQVEAWKQVTDTGAIPLDELRQVWIATKDARTRDSHREMDGEETGIGEPFSNGLLYPCDPAGPAEEVINCRCTMIIRVVEEPRA